MSAKQLAFDGFTTEAERERPDTFVRCETCDEWILRSRTDNHDGHTVVDPERFREESEDEDDDGIDIEEPVGKLFDITLSYTVDYRFRIPAFDKHDAEERAKDLQLDARPVDSYHVHTRQREVEDITMDHPKVPDDWDPYGSERLYEVWGDTDE